jgi:hypothetical protein
MEKTVLTDLERENLSSLQNIQNNLVIQLGQIEYQTNLLSKQKEQLLTQIDNFELDQAQLASKLEEKYGKGTVNLENGEFIKH